MARAINRKAFDAALDAFADAPHWYVAFSGGVDSTALLHLLSCRVKSHKQSPPLTAIHVNHGLQTQSTEWENHCGWICRFLDVDFLPLKTAVEEQGSGLEAAARSARYTLFESRLADGEILFMGHHQDDQVETFFLRLLRGAGIDGLAAIPQQRELGRGQLFRPLLDISRAQLVKYVESNGLRSIEDPSNEDTRLDRNFLRHEVLPQIERRWPGYRKTVSRASSHLGASSSALVQRIEMPRSCKSVLGDPGLPLGFLASSDDEEAAQVIRAWLRSQSEQAPDQSLLQEFLRQLRKSQRRASPLLDAGSYRVQRYRDAIYLLPERDPPPLQAVAIAPGETLAVPGVGQVSLRRCEAPGIWLAADEELELRWRTGGERIRPLGKRRNASLKQRLQEAAIPPWWRERLPLLYLQQELLAVGGLAPVDSARWGETGEEAEAPWELLWQPALGDRFD